MENDCLSSIVEIVFQNISILNKRVVLLIAFSYYISYSNNFVFGPNHDTFKFVQFLMIQFNWHDRFFDYLIANLETW